VSIAVKLPSVLRNSPGMGERLRCRSVGRLFRPDRLVSWIVVDLAVRCRDDGRGFGLQVLALGLCGAGRPARAAGHSRCRGHGHDPDDGWHRTDGVIADVAASADHRCPMARPPAVGGRGSTSAEGARERHLPAGQHPGARASRLPHFRWPTKAASPAVRECCSERHSRRPRCRADEGHLTGPRVAMEQDRALNLGGVRLGCTPA